MVTNAEELLADLHKQQGYEGGLFKMENDPRITPPGKWLRRFSLDELPQLVNVLIGDMSLVGPRPPLRHEVAQYDDDMARRLRVRPGMTGLWQVSGRSEPLLVRGHPPRPLLRRQLVDVPGPHHPGPHLGRRLRLPRRLLSPALDAHASGASAVPASLYALATADTVDRQCLPLLGTMTAAV